MRSAHLVRQAAEALLLVGLLLALAWLWQVVRYQQLLTDSGAGFINDIEVGSRGFTDIPLPQRIDALASSMGLLGYAAVTVGVALALRLYAEAATLRAGGHITPWELGDEIDDPEAE
ncbi:MAG: hypothetical protein ACRDZU_11415 [Acidimicrobiales bacterium]